MRRLTNAEMTKIYPISEVIVHRHGCLTVVRKSNLKSEAPTKNVGDKITQLSKKSRQRLNQIMQTTSTDFYSMITLTYGIFYPRNGALVKSDLKHILKYVRKVSTDYLWFLEFQKRGAPHFHIFTTNKEITPSMRLELGYKWVSRQLTQNWFAETKNPRRKQLEMSKLIGVATHELTWELIRTADGARKYAAKYSLKTKQKIVPKDYQDVGRFWGCTKAVGRIDGVRVQTTEAELRTVLQLAKHGGAQQEILPTYLWGVKLGRKENVQ